MINGSDIKVLDAISDIESDVVERYKHDKDFEPFLKLFTKEMETLEGAVTLNMTKAFCDRIGLDFNELLTAMREKMLEEEDCEDDEYDYLEDEDYDDDDEYECIDLEDEDSPGMDDDQRIPRESIPRVMFYYPGCGPAAVPATLLNRSFNIKEPGTKEIRFADTDFWIMFHEENVERTKEHYYLTGPAAIFAFDKEKNIRTLTDKEIEKITGICLHKEEKLSKAGKPVLRLC